MAKKRVAPFSSSSLLFPFSIALGIVIAVLIVGGLYSKRMSSERRIVPPMQPTSTVSQDSLAPPVTSGLTLSILSPAANLVTKESNLQVQGKTASGAEVFINDISLKADAAGNFSTKVVLDEGENIISVAANDAEGNFATQEIVVTYEI